jgi:hypothetical protein
MALYRCAKCGYIAETVSPVGQKDPCLRCGTPSTVYGTVFYAQQLIERYMNAIKEIKALKLQVTELEAEVNGEAAPVADAAPSPAPAADLADVDLRNTSVLATAEQHAPLEKWFAGRQISARFDFSRVDTTGFFDDAALMLGEGYGLFGELIERVRYAYRKGHTSLHLELANLAQKDVQAITHLCRQLYSHTFFARYIYQKPEKIVRLNVQSTQAVRQFFEGGWLEWYAFGQTLEAFKQRRFSCARGVQVVFPNEDLHELDVVVLPEGQPPLCIECKSGEFRRDIDKYLRLRKRLGLERSRFILCSTDLTDEQAKGLSAMYELTFVNLTGLSTHLASLR